MTLYWESSQSSRRPAKSTDRMARSDGALSKLVQWKVSLPMQGRGMRWELQGPFQSKLSYDSVSSLLLITSRVFETTEETP